MSLQSAGYLDDVSHMHNEGVDSIALAEPIAIYPETMPEERRGVAEAKVREKTAKHLAEVLAHGRLRDDEDLPMTDLDTLSDFARAFMQRRMEDYHANGSFMDDIQPVYIASDSANPYGHDASTISGVPLIWTTHRLKVAPSIFEEWSHASARDLWAVGNHGGLRQIRPLPRMLEEGVAALDRADMQQAAVEARLPVGRVVVETSELPSFLDRMSAAYNHGGVGELLRMDRAQLAASIEPFIARKIGALLAYYSTLDDPKGWTNEALVERGLGILRTNRYSTEPDKNNVLRHRIARIIGHGGTSLLMGGQSHQSVRLYTAILMSIADAENKIGRRF